jgi:glycine cleavage system transcriptional repressor
VGQIILTAVGTDRPGLVAELSRHVHEAGASLADSRMVNLRGHFALLALIEGADDVVEKLSNALAAKSEAMGLRLEIQPVEASKAPRAAASVPYRLKTYSMDQPGIVARVTAVLEKHGVNVEELETRVESAPFAGTPLFLLEGVVSVPSGVAIRKLRDDLTALGDTIGCDVDLDPA